MEHPTAEQLTSTIEVLKYFEVHPSKAGIFVKDTMVSAIMSDVRKGMENTLNHLSPAVDPMTGNGVATRDQVMDMLTKDHKLSVATTEQFGSGNGGIWVQDTCDHLELFDYHAGERDPDEERYTGGVNNELYEKVCASGWHFEWYDADTMMVFED